MKPRLGFLGVGWIGRNRLEALVQSGIAEVVAVADPVDANAAAAMQVTPCQRVTSLQDLLDRKLDGLVIATPSALHAEQARAALEQGVAVFCQKPLARTAAETASVVELARRGDKLLGVDLSYRFVEAVRRVRGLVRSGELGSIYAADLVFHNAYGPDKQWFYDPTLSGGGCVIDLGIHLVDLLLWSLEPRTVSSLSARLFAQGQPLTTTEVVEDFAWAELQLDDGAAARLACSWNLSAGQDAVIEVAFFGTRGAARLRNVNGSFYDFTAERMHGTARERLSAPPDDWGGRALVDWARRLSEGQGYDPATDQLIAVADVIDAIYARQTLPIDPDLTVEQVLDMPAGSL
jgi:predicted dehydrogenase